MSIFQALLHSIDLNKSLEAAKYSQLATITLQRTPAVRWVVVRSVQTDQQQLVITTDMRTNKVAEIKANPHCELCWYFPLTKEQYRFTAKATVIAAAGGNDDGADEQEKLRSDIWKHVPTAIQTTFKSTKIPGDAVTNNSPQSDESSSASSPSSSSAVSDNFGLIILAPTFIDYLYLEKPQISPLPIPFAPDAPSSEQARWKLSRNGEQKTWNVTRVNP